MEPLEDRSVPAITSSFAGIFSINSGTDVRATALAANETEVHLAANTVTPGSPFAMSNGGSGGNQLLTRSSDAGSTWTQTLYNGDGLGASSGRFDGATAIDDFGNVHIVYMWRNPSGTNRAILYAISSDEGSTFTPTTLFTGPNCDKPWLAVGPDAQNPANQVVIVTYNNTSGGSQHTFARGATVTGLGAMGAFSGAVQVSDASGGNYATPAVGPNGEVVVTWQNPAGGQGIATIFVDRDTDGLTGGLTFGTDVSATTTNAGGFDFIPATPERSAYAAPFIVYDRSGGAFNGRLYLLYADEPVDESNNWVINARQSNDNGATWAAAVQVSGSSAQSRFLQSASVDQDTGILWVAYYDCRNDGGTVGGGYTDAVANTETQFFATASVDGGASFLTDVVISNGVSSENRADPDGNDYGDYTGIGAVGGSAYVGWADNANGVSNDFDVAVDRIWLSSSGGQTITATGGPGADAYYVRRDATGTFLQIYENQPTLSGTPAFTATYAAVQSLVINSGAGADTLFFDYTNGDPIPVGGFTYDGDADVATKVWDGGGLDSDWQNSLNWTGNTLPGPSDTVGIAAGFGTISFTGVATIQSMVVYSDFSIGSGSQLSLSGGDSTIFAELNSSGDIIGNGNLAVTGKTTWSGGAMGGGGVTIAQGGLDVDNTSFLKDNRLLTVRGSGIWTAGYIYLEGTAQFLIDAGALLDCKFAPGNFWGIYPNTGSGVVSNLGELRNSNPNSGPVIAVPFDNLAGGLVFATAGTIDFQADGNNFSVFDGGSLGTVKISGGTMSFQSGASGGLGNYTLEVAVSGTLSVDANVNVRKMLQSGGIVTGPANLTAALKYTWTGGTMSGSGQTYASNGLDIDGTVFIIGRLVRMAGSGKWTSGYVYMDDGAQFIVDNGAAVFECDFVAGNSYGFYRNTNSGAALITNHGTFRNKNANTIAVAAVSFANNGGIYATAGAIRLENGGVNNGNFDAALGAVVQIAGGTMTFQNGGNGGVGNGAVELAYGTLHVAAASTVGNMKQSGGNIAGPANLTATGKFTWTGGIMDGAGQTIAAGGLDIDGTGFLAGRLLKAQATGKWTSGYVYIDNGSQFIIDNGGVINCEHAPASSWGFYRNTAIGAATISNLGVFRNKNANSGPLVAVTFNNTGLVDAMNGSIRFQKGGVNTGTFNGAVGATIAIESPGDVMAFQTPALQGTGGAIIQVVGGTLRADSAASFAWLSQSGGELAGTADIVVSGDFAWSGGIMTGTGDSIVNGSMAINGSGFLAGRDLLLNGSGSYSNGYVYLDNGSKLTIGAGGALHCTFAPASSLGFYRNTNIGTAQLIVDGLFTLTAPNTQVLVNLPATVNGTVRVDGGEADFYFLSNYASGTLTGGTYIAKGRLLLSDAVTTLAANLTMDGVLSQLIGIGGIDQIQDLAAIATAGSLTVKGGRVVNLDSALSTSGALLVESGSQLNTLAGDIAQSGSSSVSVVLGSVDPAGNFLLAGGILQGTGTVFAPATASGPATMAPGQSPGLLTVTGDLNLDSSASLAIELNGTAAGAQYDQLKVNGSVTLNNVMLNATRAFTPTAGTQFVVVDNDAADAIVGTFSGLAEGAAVVISGVAFTISYTGGTGNDVVLTAAAGDTTAPTITGLFLDGSAWTTAFRNAAGNAAYGYPAQTGSLQLKSMPWGNVNTLYVHFSEPVTVAASQVGVRGINVLNYNLASVTMATPSIAKIVLVGNVDADRLILDLDGDSGSAIADAAGNRLAGAWVEGVSEFPTAGVAGADFKYRFVVAVGDADRNGLVRNADLNLVRNNLFVDVGQAGYDIYRDIDGNGLTRNADLNAVRNHLFIDPPAGPGPNRPLSSGAGRIRDQRRAAASGRYVGARAVDETRSGVALRRMPVAQTAEVLDRLFEAM